MRRRWAGIFFIAAVLFVSGCVGQTPRDAGAADKMFTLMDSDGTSISLAQTLKDHKAVLINFWATWCPPCREEIPGLIELQKKFGDKGFTVLGVDVGESPAKVGAFIRKNGINYPVALDREQSVAESYGVVGIPTSFLLDSSGRFLGEYHSYSDELGRDIEKALK